MIAAIRSPSSVSTMMWWGTNRSSSASQLYAPNAGWPFALVGASRQRRRGESGTRARKAATASRPWNQVGYGGIVMAASSASMATTASTSVRSQAATNLSTILRSASSPRVRSVVCWLRSGSLASTVRWARCRALSIDTGVVSSASATSRAENPSTSRRMSTARWRAGRCWRAAMKASSTLSRRSYTASGPAGASSRASCSSGYGSIHTDSTIGWASSS